MIDWNEVNSEDWEFFARDYLAELSYVIEVEPGRGADAGRDLLVSEQLKGISKSRPFRWLVSCKQFAKSGDSVGLKHEPDVADRVAQHGADGFVGFYSTLASSALVERLRALKANNSIEDYLIFDGSLITKSFYTSGFSNLALRYIPKGYEALRPIQPWLDRYYPLECEICGRDLLSLSISEPYSGNLVWGKSWVDVDAPYEIAAAVCKGACDRQLQDQLKLRKIVTRWEDVSDLVNPGMFMKHMMAQLNQARANCDRYTDEAFARNRAMLLCISQRVLREVTKEDKQRLSVLVSLEGL